MRISKNSAFMYADITLKDLGECDVNKAVAEFESAPWQEQFAFSDKLTKEGEDSVLPDITFPIDDVHLTVQLAEDGVNFNVEVWVNTGKKFLRIFGGKKCFELKKVSHDKAIEYIRAFFGMDNQLQLAFFEKESKTYS